MKKLIGLILLVIFSFATANAQTHEIVKTITNVKGKVQVIGDGMAVIVPDDNVNMRYFSNNLPEEYKKEGLPVTFSADVYKVQPNVRTIGQPMKIKTIAVSPADKKKWKVAKKRYCFK